MGACKRASRFAGSYGLRRAGCATRPLLALLVFSALGCTAAGEYEPNIIGSDRGPAGAAGAPSPSGPGQAPAGSPTRPAPALDPGEALSPVDLLPGDMASESGGATRTGAEGVVLDAGLDASDGGDGGDAGSNDSGAPPDTNAPPNEADAGTPPNELDASVPTSEPDATPAPPPTPPRPPCPGLVFEDSCYEFFGEPVPWSEAEARCVAWGGHLASVESPEEDAFLGAWPALVGLPFLEGSGLWLGGSDARREYDFRWWDGRTLGFAGWATGQPNNGVGVDCVEKRNDGTQRWYDRRCTDSERYVCERPD
jgi:hypothetical protein